MLSMLWILLYTFSIVIGAIGMHATGMNYRRSYILIGYSGGDVLKVQSLCNGRYIALYISTYRAFLSSSTRNEATIF